MRHFRFTVALALAGLIFSQLSGSSAAAAPATSPPADILGVAHGAHLRPTVGYGSEVHAFNQLVGKKIAVLMYFLDWSSYDSATGDAYDPYLLNQILDEGQLPASDRPVIMLTWQPFNGRQSLGCDADYAVVTPSDIVAGKCDSYIIAFAQALKARPERILLRFAHEMNITDYPWWPGHYGQDAGLYVSMWRHVYDVFSTQGVGNVEWVWSPNYASNPPDPWNALHNYYPGDQYVDWIGLSGYNWFNQFSPPLPWMTFNSLYDSVLADLACRYAKPQLIAEIGSVDGGTPSLSKADWITDAYQKSPDHPFLRGVVWFNDYAFEDPGQADFRVTTGTAQDPALGVSALGAWTTAYSQSISASQFATSLPSLSDATPVINYCGDGSVEFTLEPGSVLLAPGDSSTHQLAGMLLESQKTVSLVFSDPSVTGNVTPSNILDPPWDQVTIQISVDIAAPLGVYTVDVEVDGQVVGTIQINVVASVSRLYLPTILNTE